MNKQNAGQGIRNCNRRVAGSVAQHFYLISREC